MRPIAEYKYFTAYQDEVEFSPSAKRPLYTIRARDAGILGYIEWYEPWRQWVLEPSDDTIWSVDCLRDVLDAIEKIKRKEKR